MKGQRFARRMGYAWQGLRAAWRRDASVRTHGVAAALTLAAMLVTRAPAVWWAVVSLTVGAVFAAELFNSAIEALADHLHPGQHPAIGVVKDIAAAAVLACSLAALIVGGAFLIGHAWPWWLGRV